MLRGLLSSALCAAAGLAADIVWVANNSDVSVSVIDTVADTVTTITNRISMPFNVAFTPDGKFAFVTNQGTNSLSVFDTTTLNLVTSLSLSGPPNGVSISPDGKTGLIAVPFSLVQILDVASLTITGNVNDPGSSIMQPETIAFSPDSNTAYVINVQGGTGAGSVSVVDMTQNPPTVVDVMANPSFDFNLPTGSAVSPDGSTLYVANFMAPINVIATATNTFITTIPAGNFSVFLALTQDGTAGFVANNADSDVTKFDATTNTFLYNIPITPVVPGAPIGVAVSPGNTVYVTNTGLNEVDFFSVSSMAVQGSYPVGMGPFGLAVQPQLGSPVLSGCKENNVFLAETDRVNVISWTTPAGAPPVSYQIYRDAALTDLIGIVPASTGTLQFLDHNRRKGQAYTYYVVSVGQYGAVSVASQITVTQKCK